MGTQHNKHKKPTFRVHITWITAVRTMKSNGGTDLNTKYAESTIDTDWIN